MLKISSTVISSSVLSEAPCLWWCAWWYTADEKRKRHLPPTTRWNEVNYVFYKHFSFGPIYVFVCSTYSPLCCRWHQDVIVYTYAHLFLIHWLYTYLPLYANKLFAVMPSAIFHSPLYSSLHILCRATIAIALRRRLCTSEPSSDSSCGKRRWVYYPFPAGKFLFQILCYL